MELIHDFDFHFSGEYANGKFWINSIETVDDFEPSNAFKTELAERIQERIELLIRNGQKFGAINETFRAYKVDDFIFINEQQARHYADENCILDTFGNLECKTTDVSFSGWWQSNY